MENQTRLHEHRSRKPERAYTPYPDIPMTIIIALYGECPTRIHLEASSGYQFGTLLALAILVDTLRNRAYESLCQNVQHH